MRKNLISLLKSARPGFLLLTPICVGLGAGAVVASGGTIRLTDLLLVLLGALLAHLSVNLLNEYADFASGLDFRTRKTPFSGGSGSLPGNPGAAIAVRDAGLLTLVATTVIGLFLIGRTGLLLLPVGILGVLIIWLYTGWITRRPLLCLLAPGVGFGPLMVTGTALVLSGGFLPEAAMASVPPLLLVSALLLLNQLPDVDADRHAGRRHVPIVIGRRRAALLAGAMLLSAYPAIGGAVLAGYFPLTALAAIIPLVAAIGVIRGTYRHADSIPDLVPFLALNLVTVIATLALLAAGLAAGPIVSGG